VPLPAALDTAAFRAAWQDWCEHRTRLALTAPGKFWNARAAGNTLLECARNGAERSIRAIERSVANGWQGLIWQRLTTSIPREPRAVPMVDWRSVPERWTEPAPDSIPEPSEPSIATAPPQPSPVWRPRLEPLPPPCQWTPKPRPRNPLDDLPPLDSQAFIAGLRGHSNPSPPHEDASSPDETDAPGQTKRPETSAEDVNA
jgi:hypothetical protein